MNEIKIDSEFSKYVPSLSPEEFKQLKTNIQAEGCREPLVIWEEENILVDGHNRHKICTENHVSFQIQMKSFPDREAVLDWIDCNQLGRRNLSTKNYKMVLGRRYNRMKKTVGAPVGNDNASNQLGQNDPIDSTAANLSKQHGVSPSTVKRAGKFAEAVQKIAVVAPEFDALEEKQKTVIAAAQIVEKLPNDAAEIISKGEKEILAKDRELKAAIHINKQSENDSKERPDEAAEVNETNHGYDVILIDIPSFLQQRGLCQPGQVITVLKEAELIIPYAKDCHVWAWTTHENLPVAFKLLEKWSLQYKCTFVWHKPEATTMFYRHPLNCEFAIYATKGSAEFVGSENFPVCFSADMGTHGYKPEIFHEHIRNVTTGKKLSMYHHQKVVGFDSKAAA